GDAAGRDDWCSEAGGVSCSFDLRHQRHGAAERAAFIGESRRHAFITAPARVGINRLPDLRLFRIFELAAFRDGKIVETGFREFDTEVGCIRDPIATGDYFVTEKSHPDDIVVTDAFADGAINFQRQSQAILARAAITIVAIIECAEEPSHRVSVRVVQLNTVEAGFARTRRSISEDSGKNIWQIANVRKLSVRHAFTISETQ